MPPSSGGVGQPPPGGVPGGLRTMGQGLAPPGMVLPPQGSFQGARGSIMGQPLGSSIVKGDDFGMHDEVLRQMGIDPAHIGSITNLIAMLGHVFHRRPKPGPYE